MKQKRYGVKLKRILNYFPPVYQYVRSQSTHQLSKWYSVSKELITTQSSKRSFWDSQNLCSHILTLNCHELHCGAAVSLAERHKKAQPNAGIQENHHLLSPLWKFLSFFLAALSPFAFMHLAIVASLTLTYPPCSTSATERLSFHPNVHTVCLRHHSVLQLSFLWASLPFLW